MSLTVTITTFDLPAPRVPLSLIAFPFETIVVGTAFVPIPVPTTVFPLEIIVNGGGTPVPMTAFPLETIVNGGGTIRSVNCDQDSYMGT